MILDILKAAARDIFQPKERWAKLSKSSLTMTVDNVITNGLYTGRYIYYNTWLVVDITTFKWDGWYTLHLINGVEANVPGDAEVVLTQSLEDQPVDPPPHRYGYRGYHGDE